MFDHWLELVKLRLFLRWEYIKMMFPVTVVIIVIYAIYCFVNRGKK